MAHVPLREIARLAGVSRMTVSRVIRNHPHVSADARARVRRALSETGYSPNPLLGLLMQTLRRSRLRPLQAGMAYVADRRMIGGDLGRLQERFLAGARSAADGLGYRLEVIDCDGSAAALRVARRMVDARGLVGAVLGRMPRISDRRMPVEFEVPYVVLGEQWVDSVAHRVENDQVRAARSVLQQLRLRGYQRPGWMHPGAADPENDFFYRIVFSHFQLDLAESVRIPVFGAEGFNEKRFRVWFATHRPDALICKQQVHIAPWIARLGVRVPEELGLCSPDVDPAMPEISGVAQFYEKTMGTAVELVDGMVRRNERGAPVVPTYTLVEGDWSEGRTLMGIPAGRADVLTT